MVPAMETFVAIDFETATAQRASACAIGWSKFDDGVQTQSGATLIDPRIAPDEWSGFNIHIHGIHPEDVVGAPDFIAAWNHVCDVAGGSPLAAHNASFDISVARAEMLRFGVQPTPFHYTCSAALARVAWPEMLSVSLQILADELDIDLDHHDAGSDANACGQILVAAVRELEVDSIEDAFAKTGRRWGEVSSDLTWSGGGPTGGLHAKDMAAHTDDFDRDHPLYGKVVVFTGTLHSMTRREAFQRVLDIGGQPGDGVTKHTNLLVVGEQDMSRLAEGQAFSGKQRKAFDFRQKGLDIQLMGEVDFLRLL